MLKTIDNLPALKREIGATLRRIGDLRPFLLVWGQRTAKQARQNARAKGGRRFWFDVARAVQVRTVTADTVSVHTRHVAAAQKQFGGEIRPKPGGARALTIPITEEARGKRASEFELGGRDLFVINRSEGDTAGILGYSDGDAFHALFVLRRRVHQRPDPWWPTDWQVWRFGLDEAKRYIQRAIT